MQWIYSTQQEKQAKGQTSREGGLDACVHLDGKEYQTMSGFGGCFNELGYLALGKLPQDKRDEVLDALFLEEGLNLCYNRLPIGASDYAESWYSLNETDGDYDMECFSIERDRGCLIPYIREAQKRRSDMTLFASPWSPPSWMKFPKAYNYGTLVWDERTLQAYALYFEKFVKAYAAEGVRIDQVHVQNEPVADQKFPSCVWTGEQMRDFIRDYLGPRFEQSGMDTEIWLGTLNCPDENNGGPVWQRTNYNCFANTVLMDAAARRYVCGVSYQWAGKYAVAQTHRDYPDVKLIQSENECGNGENSWAYAMYVFTLMSHYITNGVSAYTYWNMALENGGRSTWGWWQNSMVSVDPQARTYMLNPEFYLFWHFSHFVKPGAVVLGTQGNFSSNTVAFRNPDGQVILVMLNPFGSDKVVEIEGGEKAVLPPQSINTFIL